MHNRAADMNEGRLPQPCLALTSSIPEDIADQVQMEFGKLQHFLSTPCAVEYVAGLLK